MLQKTGHVTNVPHRVGHVTNVPHMKIGIAWQGSQKYAGDAHRSVPLREFAPLAKIRGVQLIGLQKGYGSERLQKFGKRWNIVDFAARLDADGAFVDTAAILAHLDLVVTSDSAIAQLAGTLGTPVWMPLSMAADWRWMREGTILPCRIPQHTSLRGKRRPCAAACASGLCAARSRTVI
jgi:hypothetical protein